MHDVLPITALFAGQVVEVRQVVGTADQVRRMEELGVRSGVILEIVRAGTPCIVRLGATKLCFRDADSCAVLVAARKSA